MGPPLHLDIFFIWIGNLTEGNILKPKYLKTYEQIAPLLKKENVHCSVDGCPLEQI